VSKTIKRNLPASVRQRLLTLSRNRQEPFNTTLVRYAIERLLYRLSMSPYADRFLLKGAMLFAIWSETLHRPTQDVDLLGHGDPDVGQLQNLFREICSFDVEPDGLNFLPETVHAEIIRDQAAYSGVRITIQACLTKARIPVQVDIGFGDAVTPGPEDVRFPALLNFPSPRLRAYPVYTVVAEKIEAMVSLGIANSRMKDFYDLWFMSRTFDFDGPLLAAAIRNTFERRKTDLATELPFSEEFALLKSTQWNGFVSRNKLLVPHFNELSVIVNQFVEPPFTAARKGEDFGQRWKAGADWT
jgi:hypothetical protein